jgi:antitoxin component of MazEF toxin-antitoxin module
MKTALRRIGNSFGVIIPKAIVDAWQLREGDALRVSVEGIFPPSHANGQEALDEQKRRLAAAIAARFTPRQIRAHGLANLHRWKSDGVWVSAYAEWKEILEDPDDGPLFAALLGRDERSMRLRQSPPYAGMLSRDEVHRINEETAH